MASSWSILKQALIFDIETLGLDAKKAAIHQAAWLDAKTKQVTEVFLRPNLTLTEAAKAQDYTGLKSSPRDARRAHQSLQKLGRTASWGDALNAYYLMNETSRERIAKALGVPKDKVTLEHLRAQRPELSYNLMMKELDAGGDIFLRNAIKEGRFPYFPTGGAVKSGRVQASKALTIGLEDLLASGGAFHRALKNKALWIANVNFESGNLAAAAAAVEAGIHEDFALGKIKTKVEYDKRLLDANFLREMPGYNPKSGRFHITGKEVNQARAQAFMTGDWRGVHQAIMQHTGAGDVRDVLDIPRAQQSYTQNLGWIQGREPYAFSVDVQARLYGYSVADSEAQAWKRLTTPEPHRAAGDVPIEEFVRRQSIAQTAALQEYTEGTEKGLAYFEQAKKREGPLWAAMRKAYAQEAFGPQLVQSDLTKRYARMFGDFGKTFGGEGTPTGRSVQTAGVGLYHRTQMGTAGALEDVLTSFHKDRAFQSIDEAAAYIRHQVAIPTDDPFPALREQFISKGALADVGGRTVVRDAALLEQMGKTIEEESASRVSTIFAKSEKDLAIRQGLLEGPAGMLKKGVRRPLMPHMDAGVMRGAGKYLGIAGLGIAALGIAGDIAKGPRQLQEGPESLRTMNYQRWLESQSQFAGLDDSNMKKGPNNVWAVTGMPKGGIAATFRRQMTDFGSPYQGPITSGDIFTQMDLLRERQSYINRASGVRGMNDAAQLQALMNRARFDAGGDVENPIKTAQRILQSSRASYISHEFMQGDFKPLDPTQLNGMRGKNLLQIDLSSGNWKSNMEDADTLVVQRAGAMNAISTFFGGGQSYKFRLAGIDAPETEHAGGSGFHRAQPYAYAGSEAAQAMISGAKNLSLVIDPFNVTYGRQVGTVFADGRNLNLEMIRRGMASYLPFKKKGSQEMYRASTYESASNLARASEIGMWRAPYFKAYRDIIAESGQTITFNTFTQIDKIAQNATMMSAASLMRNAQDQGFYSTAQAITAAEIGKRFKNTGFKSNFMGAHWNEIYTFGGKNAPHKSYMHQMLQDTSGLMKTKGQNAVEKIKSRNFHSLDKSLALDTLGTSSGVWNKQKLASYKLYGVSGRNARRKRSMELAQQHANFTMFNSAIGHHGM